MYEIKFGKVCKEAIISYATEIFNTLSIDIIQNFCLQEKGGEKRFLPCRGRVRRFIIIVHRETGERKESEDDDTNDRDRS